MRDLGRFEDSWGVFTMRGVTMDIVPRIMEKWMELIKSKAEVRNLIVETGREDVKTPNMARKMGGVIGFIGGIVSNTTKGYYVRDTNGKGKQYEIYLVPEEVQGGVAVTMYAYTWFNLEINMARKEMGSAIFREVCDVVNSTFNDL